MLDELGSPLDKIALAGLQLAVDKLIVGNLDLGEARHLDRALASQAALLGLVRAHAKEDLGVEHHVRVALVVSERDDGLGHADLVGGEARSVLDGEERVDQVLGHVGVGGSGGLAGRGENGLIMHELFDHERSFRVRMLLIPAELYQMSALAPQ